MGGTIIVEANETVENGLFLCNKIFSLNKDADQCWDDSLHLETYDTVHKCPISVIISGE